MVPMIDLPRNWESLYWRAWRDGRTRDLPGPRLDDYASAYADTNEVSGDLEPLDSFARKWHDGCYTKHGCWQTLEEEADWEGRANGKE